MLIAAAEVGWGVLTNVSRMGVGQVKPSGRFGRTAADLAISGVDPTPPFARQISLPGTGHPFLIDLVLERPDSSANANGIRRTVLIPAHRSTAFYAPKQ